VARQVALALSNALLYREAADERGRLQALIDSSRDGVVLIGLDRRILICNAPTLRMLELPGQPADWVGKPLRKALLSLARFAPQVLEIAIGETRRIAVGDEPAREGEYQLDNQAIHWMNLPVLGAGLGRLLVFRDVTEERNVEKMQADLAHMMVHDLRSPLTAIIGASDLLAKKMASLKDADKDLADIVRDSAERMLGLVNDILNVSQLEAGQMPLNRAPVALPPLVLEVLQLQSGAIENKHLTVESTLTDADLPMLWGDLRLLVRVLQNLVGNAVKFTPDGGQLTIDAQVEGRLLRVAVFNSGEGIPPEIRGRLFNKFVRGNQKEHGSGLGLAFCHLVVEAHGGQIWVESEPGQGATFRFTVPLYQSGD
jgi:signal transduction histidine kinase